jgi:hypothetical protein
MAVPDHARRNDDVGAVGRDPARQHVRGPGHELVQPLCLRRGRRLDVPPHRRHRSRPGRARLSPRAHRAAPGRRAHQRHHLARNRLRIARIGLADRRWAVPSRRDRPCEHLCGGDAVGRSARSRAGERSRAGRRSRRAGRAAGGTRRDRGDRLGPVLVRGSARAGRRGARGVPYPPATAPTIRNGSSPLATAAGSGASGDSCERSSWHA